MQRLAAITLILITIGPYCHSTEAAQATSPPWQVGYAEADITPEPMQVQMSGYGRERYARGVWEPLITQALVLQDQNGAKALLIPADILDFDRIMVEAIRRAITRKHDIPPQNIMLSASHTHWGPAVRFHMSFGVGAPNVWYMALMEDRILASVDRALSDLAPASIQYGSIDFRGIGCNRRIPRNGQFVFGPNPEGSFDGHTPILRIHRDQDRHQLVLVGHACHPTDSGNLQQWSPAYPGAMRDTLRAHLPNTKALFVQGCGADAKVVHQNPKTGQLVFTADPNRARAAGKMLGRAVLDHLQTGPMINLDGVLSCALQTGHLSYGEPWSQEDITRQAYEGNNKSWQTWAARQSLAFPYTDKAFQYDVQAWKLGNQLTLFALEGEVCSPWGPMVRAMANTDHAMVIGYANSTSCYIPDQRILREGGYESQSSQQVYGLPAPFTASIDTEIKGIITKALAACTE